MIKEIKHQNSTIVAYGEKAVGMKRISIDGFFIEEFAIGEYQNETVVIRNTLNTFSNIKSIIGLRDYVYNKQKEEEGIVRYWLFRFDRMNPFDKKNSSLLKIFLKKGCKLQGSFSKNNQKFYLLTTPEKEGFSGDIEKVKDVI